MDSLSSGCNGQACTMVPMSMKFYSEVIHRACVKHLAAKGLSRLSTHGTYDKGIDDDVLVLAVQ